MRTARTFRPDDQLRFAKLTGDFNPMHMDAMAARRTQAGAPVVHGIHSLLWLLDGVAAHHPCLPAIATLRVRFARMVYVGEDVEAMITQQSESELCAEVLVDDAVAVQLTAALGSPHPAPTHMPRTDGSPLLRPTAPVDRSLEDMEGGSGYLAFASDPGELGRTFPNAARLLGSRRVASLGCSTFLVGMVLPGLHSIYGSLALDICEDNDPGDYIAFKVISTDRRFGLVRIEICGGGLHGSLDTFVRQAPTKQASLGAVARLVSRNEFVGATALIIGGSRGLGELTAKVIAAGGGDVIVTYAVGRAEAEALATEISAWGGTCAIIPYDVYRDADEQLSSLIAAPTHIYYFATPIIFRRKSKLFAENRFNDFYTFYVSGFYRLVEAGLRRRPEGISVFYPSSAAVDDRPANMTEYTMAKAAGEILCADINAQMQKVRVLVARLPRLATDQTATVVPVETADPLPVMLPIIRRVHS